jgi:hypothetical protein
LGRRRSTGGGDDFGVIEDDSLVIEGICPGTVDELDVRDGDDGAGFRK